MLNESTKFISPTKTPEYLAAGVPVVSTPITDVVNPYGRKCLVHIATNHLEFIESINVELNRKDREEWLTTIDNFLKDLSWDDTYARMKKLIDRQLKADKQLEIDNNISIAS